MPDNDSDTRTLKDLENAINYNAVLRKEEQIAEMMSQFRKLHGFMEIFRDFLAGSVQEVYFMDGNVKPHVIFLTFPKPSEWIEMFYMVKEILGEEVPDPERRFRS